MSSLNALTIDSIAVLSKWSIIYEIPFNIRLIILFFDSSSSFSLLKI